jgi:hypothetical protein
MMLPSHRESGSEVRAKRSMAPKISRAPSNAQKATRKINPVGLVFFRLDSPLDSTALIASHRSRVRRMKQLPLLSGKMSRRSS